MTIISTTSGLDLSSLETHGFRFSRTLPNVPETVFLNYPYKWFIESRDVGCSCGFRHLEKDNVDFGFYELQDWYPESREDIEATLEVVQAFRSIVEGGDRLDCIDVWTHGSAEPHALTDLSVSLDTIGDDCFRFFEGYHFDLYLASLAKRNMPG